MSSKGIRFSFQPRSALAALSVGLMVLGMVGGPTMLSGAAPQDQTPETPLVQQFEDVPDSHTFAQFINALYLDNIISGYPCGSPGEPCVPPANLPYYRPNAFVTRGQMSKFVDNGRRNIADAVGESLVLSNTSPIGVALTITTTDGSALYALTYDGAFAMYGTCWSEGCLAVRGRSLSGTSYAAYFTGGRGTYASSFQSGYPGIDASSSGDSTYGGELRSSSYRGGYVKSGASGRFSLYVDTLFGPTQSTPGLTVNGAVQVDGNLYVGGSKTGYVVDAMQNADTTELEVGDVVVIAGNSAPVWGDIPVATVKKAAGPYDSGVAGIVDQVLYVPDADTKVAYEAQERAMREYMDRRSKNSAAEGEGKAAAAELAVPDTSITDEQGTVHAIPGATRASPGGYVNVVTLGSYKAVKVDASYGAIRAGDLLTTSPNPGYAMKVTDKAQATGAIIGKALGDLESGTGTIPVLVTLK